MAIIEFSCFECNTKLEFVDNVSFRGECDNCGADAHCCRNCEFYDESSYNSCRETSADVVKEKDRNNYCDFFQASGRTGGKSDKDNLMAAAEALFKKK